MTYLLSDMHLGHKDIHKKFRTQFNSDEEHDQTIITNYLNTITKRDTVYFLGDIAFSDEAIEKVQKLPGYKILVLGNHDVDRGTNRAKALQACFDKICGITSKHQIWLTHAPIHPEELRGKFNIHGHVHNKTLQDYRYANVSMENINYTPVTFQEIQEAFVQEKIFTKLN